jgi:hypothetical protein
MLKSLDQPRLSPASPSSRLYQQPRYAPASPRTTTDSGRRKSNISEPSPFPAPARQIVQYVSRGTQYSPMIQKMDDARPFPTSSTSQILSRTEPPVVASTGLPTSIPPSPTKPILQPESPSVKRKSSDTDHSSAAKNEELAPKRTRSAPTAGKILPAKYEECAVEDLVKLIASMIAELIETNDALPPRPNPVLTRFHSR